MRDWIRDYLTFDDYAPVVNDDGVLNYQPGSVLTQIYVSSNTPGHFHLQSITPVIATSDHEFDFLARLCFELSIKHGFTFYVNTAESRLDILFSASIDFSGGSDKPVFEEVKGHIFAFQCILINATAAQISPQLAEVMGADIPEPDFRPPSKIQSIIQAVARRAPSPAPFVPMEDIKLELESEVTALTGRFNYAKISLEEGEDPENEMDFSYAEFGATQGVGPMASFHASYKMKSFGDAFALSAGLVTLNSSLASVADLQQIVAQHFLDPQRNLFGYYYVTEGFGACYVARISAFLLEVLWSEIGELDDAGNLQRFEIDWCVDTFTNYSGLESISRSLVMPEIPSSYQEAQEAIDRLSGLWKSAARSYPDNPLGIDWPFHSQYVFENNTSLVRLCNVYLSKASEAETYMGLARISMESENERTSISVSVTFPSFTEEFRSKEFQMSKDNFNFEIQNMINKLSSYGYICHSKQEVIFGEVEEQPWMNSIVDELIETTFGRSTNDEQTLKSAWRETLEHWDSVDIPESLEGSRRLKFDEERVWDGQRAFDIL
jgi:hypothetical protein